jgi:hypothetical protein
LRPSLLVARARGQHEQSLSPRRADVEQVALAVELILAHGQRKPGGPGYLASVIVREERIAARGRRELPLLEPEQVEDIEAASPHL